MWTNLQDVRPGPSCTAPARITGDLPPADPAPQWTFRQFDRKDHLDKSQGNFLCGPGPEANPRYYVKEAFFPQFLCVGPGGGRLWLSTYMGLLRLGLAAPAAK